MVIPAIEGVFVLGSDVSLDEQQEWTDMRVHQVILSNRTRLSPLY